MLAGLSLVLLLTLSPVQDAAAVRQSEADFALGVELQQKGDLEGARAAYEAALRGIPRRADALTNLGVVFARLGQYGEAVKNYRAALAIDPGMQETRLNLGIAYFRAEDFARASAEL